jgi:hypothetical protein
MNKLMNLLYNKTYFYAILSIILFSILFGWINFLSRNDFLYYVQENYSNIGPIQERNDGSTSHSIDQPLTTKSSCSNFCGPTSRCSITGTQCFVDTDCGGCTPNSSFKSKELSENVPGNNESGKLTWGMSPQYSSLTTNILVLNSTVLNDSNEKPAQPNFGPNAWMGPATEAQQLFDERYKPPNNLQFMPQYEKRYEMLGDFMTDGPLPSNY